MKIAEIEKLQKELGIKNPMALPRLVKIVLGMGIKDAVSDKKNLEQMIPVLSSITGQKPKVTRAKKSIASFKLREGEEIGLVVTLRGKRMYDFFERLTKVVLPRLRDFHGVKRILDKQGNYSLGFSEYSVFPEIDPGSVTKMQGMQVTIVTSGSSEKEGLVLLEALGMPFEKTN